MLTILIFIVWYLVGLLGVFIGNTQLKMPTTYGNYLLVSVIGPFVFLILLVVWMSETDKLNWLKKEPFPID